ncbi:MAG: EAL domain-containing protein [Herbinix sp.]|nr:EAL domain-containing protein [Herbinix sp.]
MSLKKSIRILLIISSMIPVIFISVVANILLTNKLIDENSQDLKRTAETNVRGLEAMITTQKTEVSLLSLQNGLVEAARQSNIWGQLAPDSINILLQKRISFYEYCERISLYNANYKIIASSDFNLLGSNSNKLALKKFDTIKLGTDVTSGLQPFIISENTIDTIEIGSPILASKSNEIIGYVISTIETSYFKKFLSSISFGDTGFGILLDHDGTIIYHPDSSYIGKNINSSKLSHIVDNYNNNLIALSGGFKYYYNNINQSYGYCVLSDLNWVLLVKQDVSDLRAVTTILLPLLSITCVIILFIVIIFANVLAKKYSAPIIALRDAMRTAAEGNLNVQSIIKSNNELGELSKNFNKMLHIIKTNYNDLESMHDKLLSNEEQLRSNYDHIEFLAYHDTLTNLPNKLAFLDYVTTVLVSSVRELSNHAVYFVDLDNFKTVNDTLGHEYGDILLIKTAQLLTSLIGSNGMLARAGGDEFLLFKENVTSKELAVNFASEILAYFNNPLDLGGEIVYVSMSIGISIYPENGLTPNVLIKTADIAMYKSKETGKNKFTLFDKKMEEELNRNTLIIEVLRNAIENKEIYIKYQPQFDIKSNCIIGFEALMRIKSERLGNLSPSEFIPIAEESGLITELSSWLITEACRFNKNLIDHGATPRPVSVNISSVQINRPGFVAFISAILNETKLPPKYLELEITESTLVSSIMDATILLSNLQSLGVRVSLDDFGTGYSSLNYLTKLPINTLKIDKSFIDNICFSRKDSSIAESIIQLAHSLDIKVVAEGVEDEDQLCLLKAQKCDIIQGYIYNKPMHPADLIGLIHEDDSVIQCSLF